MSSTLSASQKIERLPQGTRPIGRRSWGLMALGVILLIAAGLLFWWGWRHLPRQGEIPAKYLGAIPPLGKPDGPTVAPSPSPTPDKQLRIIPQKRPTAIASPRLSRFGSVKSFKPKPAETLGTESEPRSDKASREIEPRETELNPPPTPTPREKIATVTALAMQSASPVVVQPKASPTLPLSTPTSQPVSTGSASRETSPASAPAPENPCEGKRNAFRRAFDWFIHLFKKNKRAPCSESILTVSASSSSASIMLPCPEGASGGFCTPSASTSVELIADARHPDNDTLHYTWSVTGGNLSGEGRSVIWDLSGAQPGTYTGSLEVTDGNAHTATASTTVTIGTCQCGPPPCPTISVSCPSDVNQGSPITFNASGADNVTYNWSASAGTISSGQGTSSITVNTDGLGGQTVTATVEVGGLDPTCSRITSCTASVELIQATPTPTPSSSPASSPSPSPTPGASPSPGATPRADATPSPTGTPTVAPTPAKILRESDKITATYPEPFLKDKESTVSLNLARVDQDVEVTQSVDVTTGTASVTDKAPLISGAARGTLTPDNAGLYDTVVVVELQATGLVVLGEASQMKLYNRADQNPNVKPNETWTWRVTPQTNFTGRAELRFRMSLLWKLRDPELYPDKDKEIWKLDVWPHPQEVHIGQPKLFVYGSTIGSLPLGLGAMGFIGIGWRRRKKLTSGEVEQQAVKANPRPPVAAETGDEVTSTVYAPGRQRPGDSFLIQVFMHLDEQADALDKLATRADEDAYERDQTKLGNIMRGTNLSFHLTMPGLDIKAPDLTCVWNGGPESVRFEVTVPDGLQPRDIVATVIVAQNSLPIGTLKFKFKVVSADSVEPAISNYPTALANLSRFRRAFISYSSNDIDEVEKRVQGFIAAKIECFMDVLNLQPGEKWEEILYKRIDESDAFFLFWSTAAKTSAHVKEEAMYADGRKKGKYEMPPDIIPIAVEHPIPEPWPEFSTLHFRDPIFR